MTFNYNQRTNVKINFNSLSNKMPFTAREMQQNGNEEIKLSLHPSTHYFEFYLPQQHIRAEIENCAS